MKFNASRSLPLFHPGRLIRVIPAGFLAILWIASVNVRADYADTVSSFSPLAFWRFNETNSSPALNQVANSSTLGSTLNGNIVMDAARGEAGIVGNSVRFHNPGNSILYCGSKIDVPYQAAINPNPPFTIEFWAKPATLSGSDGFGTCPVSSINPHFSSVNRSGWLFYLNNSGQWQFRLGSENNYAATLNASSGNASTGVWQHIVGSYDGTTAKLYVNGAQVGSSTLSAAANAAFRPNTQSALRIGGTSLNGSLSAGPVISAAGVSGNRGFDGWVDEVAVYASELSPEIVAAHYAAASTNNAGYGTQILAANPVGYWNLNEPVVTPPSPGTYPVAANSGSLGSTADGTNLWGVLAAQAGLPYAGLGAGNQACFFNGTSGYLLLGSPAGLNLSNHLTLMAWIKPDVKDFFRDILAHGWDGGHQETFLRISRGSGGGGYGTGNYYEVGVTDGTNYYDAASFPIPEGDLGNWVFLAGTYDGANWNLYRNGVLAAALASTHGARAVAGRWSVGSRSDPSAAEGVYYGGSIDEPAIFGSALSATDIAGVYNAAQVPPVVIRSPQSATNYETYPMTFSVSAAGNVPLSYQWAKDGSDIPGATNSTYAINSLAFSDAGSYLVRITNSLGGTKSAEAILTVLPAPAVPDGDVQLTEVPDYTWYAGCFGTACGNLMGYWDRHGLPDFYTGPTGGGVAPLDSCLNNLGIRSMMATKAGLDGRPADQPGHIDDYWASYTISLASCGANDSYSYESTLDDPYKLANRPEHPADCIADFIGVNQKRWTNMNNECDGNIDAYSFVYWDTNGSRRVNFIPPAQGTNAGRDIPSGLREWTRYRGYDAEVFSQLVDFNPNCPSGQGFTFGELRAEIDAGYPVLVFLQPYAQFYRALSGMPKANPEIHGMLVYGYQAYAGFGTNVYCRTSWGSGDNITYNWSTTPWTGSLSVRGVIGYHPRPKIRSIAVAGADVTITWDGPASQLYDVINGTTTPIHTYQLERSNALDASAFAPVGPPTTDLHMTISDCCDGAVFYRVQLLAP